ncbi:MAG: SAM-dependent chlorinase/fluorinase [Sulfurimicrobium sp.]|jgi:hypothetical protein|nr:SAM-dependent chlorinase/fluorinase [Sulfurimicrobium sp.]MDZ7654523.1 SAM-dependent chlorinase/fluorinase [Sulfurimicrobium sp.]
MILLFTDYGSADPYSGLMRVAIWAHAPDVAIVDLLHEAPSFNTHASAHLLSAMSSCFPIGSVCVAVVDPGVGSARNAVVMHADEKWYVGPDNGLLSVVAGRALQSELWRIDWRPEYLSDSFHGRDLFAPIAAWIDRGAFPHSKLSEIERLNIGLDYSDLAEVIYIDHYGNIMTGMRAAQIQRNAQFLFGSSAIEFARVFSDGLSGRPFWYKNSLGLVEFAINGASAALFLGAQVGDQFEVYLPD